jgi:hypothetical protein
MDLSLDTLVARTQPYDMKRLIVKTGGRWRLLRFNDYAKNIIIGFARMEGQTIGIVANNTLVLASFRTSRAPSRPRVSCLLRLLQHPVGDFRGRARFHAQFGCIRSAAASHRLAAILLVQVSDLDRAGGAYGNKIPERLGITDAYWSPVELGRGESSSGWGSLRSVFLS